MFGSWGRRKAASATVLPSGGWLGKMHAPTRVHQGPPPPRSALRPPLPCEPGRLPLRHGSSWCLFAHPNNDGVLGSCHAVKALPGLLRESLQQALAPRYCCTEQTSTHTAKPITGVSPRSPEPPCSPANTQPGSGDHTAAWGFAQGHPTHAASA